MWQWVTVTRNQFSGIDGDTVTFANQSLNALANKPVGLVGVFFFFFFWLHRTACGILVPWTGIKPVTSAMKVQSLNHWTTGEFPGRRPFNFLAKSLDPTSTLGMFSFLSDLSWFHPLEIPDYGMWSSKWPQDRESCNSKEQVNYHKGGIITQNPNISP